MVYTESLEGSMGNIALWVGFAFFVFSSIVFLFLSYVRNVKYEARFFYYITTLINAIAALAYLIMALGNASYTNNGRSFHWIRYAQWALVAPLTIIDLGLLAGGHWVEIFFIAFASMIGVGAGFAGALSTGANATWPLYGFGIAAGIVVAISLLYTFRASAYRVHTEIGKLYDILAFGSVLLYIGYVVVWGTSEGGKWTTADQEIIIYTVLDILTKAVFGFVLLFAREAIARYGSFLGLINTGVEYDLPIPKSVTHSESVTVKSS